MKWLSRLSAEKASLLVHGTIPSRSYSSHIPSLSSKHSHCALGDFQSHTHNKPSATGVAHRHFSTKLPYTFNSNNHPTTTPHHDQRFFHKAALHYQITRRKSGHGTNLNTFIPSSTRTMSLSASLVESAKKSAAYQAVNDYLLPSYKYVGIGSGSTVVYVVDAIVSKGRDFYGHMTFIPTGSQSKGLIRAAGLNLANLDERPLADGKPVALDVAFDGADEVDEDLNLIKGGGACLFQEKLVAIAAKQFVAVADYRKQSPRLCTTWKTIPIEVLPMAAPDVLLRLQAMGSPKPVVRSGLPSKAGECVTDNGMWIIDAPFAPLLLPKDVTSDSAGSGQGGAWEVSALANELLRTPGIVEIGLFHGFNGDEAVTLGKLSQAQKPVAAYFGLANGEVQVQKAS